MTPTDLSEAQRRAKAWHTAHPDMRNRDAPPSDPGRGGVVALVFHERLTRG